MKSLTYFTFTVIFWSICFTSQAQPQKTFMDNLTVLEFSRIADIKGKFVYENSNGDANYMCSKPLLGFTVFIVQANGKSSINALANSIAPLPPKLEHVLDQLTKVAAILGTTKKDSETDAGLRGSLSKLPAIKRIIVFAKTDGSSVSFFVSKDDDYMIYITPKN